MLIQRIGIEHLRIWILIVLFSMVQTASIRNRTKRSESIAVLFDSDYDDSTEISHEDANTKLRKFENFCLQRSQTRKSSAPSLIDSLCSTIMKKN